MIKSKVISIGENAIDNEDKLLILFGPDVSDRLKEISVIQKIENADDFKIEKGMHLTIDDQVYEISYVGKLVETNFDTIHHTVLDFNPVPDEPRNNGIYLTPTTMPQIHENSSIVIE